MKLHVKALVLECVLGWEIGVFAIAWCVLALDGVYGGFTFAPMGSVSGLLWALPGGLVLGGLAEWISKPLSEATSGWAASGRSSPASS